MVLPTERAEALFSALKSGVLPKRLKSNRYALRIGGLRGFNVTLVNKDGPTEEGVFVYGELGLSIPTDLS